MTAFAMPRRTFLASCAAASAALRATGVRAAGLQTIHVASALQDDIAALLYGISSGIFAKLGLDVQVQPANSGAAAAAAVLAGDLQIAKGGTMAIVLGHSHNVPLTAIWPAAISATATPICGLIVLRASTIESAKDCNGKTFTGASLQDLNQLGAMAWVDTNGGDSKTMKFVEVPSSETIPALQAKRIDGATVLNPTLQIALRSPDIRVLANPFDAVSKHFCSSTWFTTRDYVAKNPDVVRRFVTGLQQASRYEAAHPAEMGKVLAPFLKQDEATLASFPRTPGGVTLDPADYQPVINLAAKYGAIPSPYPASEILTAFK